MRTSQGWVPGLTRGGGGPTPRCPRSPPAKRDLCFHGHLPMPAPGTHTSPPLPSLSTWTCSDHLLGLPFRSQHEVFPNASLSLLLHGPQDKDRAPYPGVQGLSSRPMAAVLNFMCVFAWALGWPDIWSDIILGVSVRVFWMRLTFKLE